MKLKQAAGTVADVPVIELVNRIVNVAVTKRASDIHIEPTRHIGRVRFRIDGLLVTYLEIQSFIMPMIVSRLKFLGRMDISNRLTPQDGRFLINLSDGGSIDFRLSTFPTAEGEKAVVRLIYNVDDLFNENDVGFLPAESSALEEMISGMSGAVLVTGPTGSGKTSTLASIINTLDKESLNIVSVEDPIEILIEGVNQTAVNPKINLNFPDVLKFLLRQDPDVIMVGEIRDVQTAELVVEASITGHLVLSTLHTTDVASAITRFLDMGIESYLLASAIKGIISQRLVRRICPYCKETFMSSDSEMYMLNLSAPVKLAKGRGCRYCTGTGFFGRFAVYEYFIIDKCLRSLINAKASEDEIKLYLNQAGMVTMWDRAVQHVLSGHTTIHEIFRAVSVRGST